MGTVMLELPLRKDVGKGKRKRREEEEEEETRIRGRRRRYFVSRKMRQTKMSKNVRGNKKMRW